uniref:Ig-like domain-containing protein n=1 Tax=Neolamprologus brichardi TaxID=32507 RepID=A0A3Q4HBN5_NEOBR
MARWLTQSNRAMESLRGAVAGMSCFNFYKVLPVSNTGGNTFTCQYVFLFYVITWLSPSNKVISPALDKYQVLDDGTLVVQKIQGFDKGNYTCIARNNAGQDHEVTRLEVLITPPVISGLRGTLNAIKVTAVQNQQKLLDCNVHGNPSPRVTWLLPGNLTLSAPYYSNRMVVHQNGTLEIHSPKETDSGQLVCIARNEGGEVRLVVNLDVKTVDETPQIRAPKANVQSLSVEKINVMVKEKNRLNHIRLKKGRVYLLRRAA